MPDPTYDWTDLGREILPVQHRATFLAHLRGEITEQPAPERIEWLDPVGKHPATHAESLKAAVHTYRIWPVVKVAYNMTWMADQHTHKPGPSLDAESYAVIGIQNVPNAYYFVVRGMTITPVLIEVLAEPNPDPESEST